MPVLSTHMNDAPFSSAAIMRPLVLPSWIAE